MLFNKSKKKGITLRAKFIGKDGSCGFHNGAVYNLKVATLPDYIVVYSAAGCCPYESWELLFENWDI